MNWMKKGNAFRAIFETVQYNVIEILIINYIGFQDTNTIVSENEKPSNGSIYDVKPSIFEKSNGFESTQ
jgi:hypothetical protein